MNQYVIAITGFLSFGCFLVIIEILSRILKLPSEWIRRVSHVFAALFTIFFGFYLEGIFLLAILGIFSAVMLVSRLLKIFNHIHSVSRLTIGEELLPIGFISAYLISKGQMEVFVPSMLIIGLADPITGIVMQKWRKHYFGILAFTIVTMPIILSFIHISFAASFVIALLIAIIERISPYGTDNFSIPTISALLLTLIKI